MSAYGYKRTFRGQLANVRITPKSGHSQRKSASDSKSRHPMSAMTPKADINGYDVGGPLLAISGS
jgi:hypothetical protein